MQGLPQSLPRTDIPAATWNESHWFAMLGAVSRQNNPDLKSMSTASDKIDCRVRVVTPENIAFEYRLAGPFQRLPAFIFDFLARCVIFIGLVFMTGLVFSQIPLGGTLTGVLGVLLFFFLSWFYGIFFETRFNGRTLGKMLVGLRSISTDGRPINGMQAALRNLLRSGDMGLFLSLQIFDPEAPPAYIIPTFSLGLAVMLLSPRMQRIGDLAAGTMVIVEGSRRGLSKFVPEDPRAFGLAELIPAAFRVNHSLAQTIGLYMENRGRLSPARRREIARHLATPLIQQFELMQDTSPDLLLCALYVRTFMSEEQQKAGRDRMRRTLQPAVPLATVGGTATTPVSPSRAAPPREFSDGDPRP
ncbi:MAG: RDD family protein [Planctomycetota bacterium]|nr:MAG: RDD family protein [Planctomycetota bacterium]